jgi:hypothetical protein
LRSPRCSWRGGGRPWELFLGALWLVGAMLKGIWNFICGLFGWN